MSESPQERVARMVDLQVQQRHRDGVAADAAALTAVTAKLLSIADSERAAPRQVDTDGKTSAEVRAKKRETSGEALAEMMGGEFYYRDLGEQTIGGVKPGTKIPTGVEGERHIALMRRIAMIVAKDPAHRPKLTDAPWAGCQYPRLAQLLYMNTLRAALDKPGRVGTGRYADLSKEDRHRVFYAQLERICNLSDAVIRPGWWVK